MSQHTRTRRTRDLQPLRGARRLIASLAVGLMAFGGLAAVEAATAPAAEAATVALGSVEGRIANHVSTDAAGTASSRPITDCLREQPAGSPVGATAWVTAGNWAYAGHGRNGGVCPTNLNLATQSVLGFQPAALGNVETGQIFNLGMMTHRNNPVAAGGSTFFKGDLQVRLTATGTVLTFPWWMWETPNGDNPCAVGPNNVLCYDQTRFTAQIAPTDVIGADGLPYQLVVWGFTPDNNGQCTGAPNGTYNNNFLTPEGVTTNGCLYASMEQRRTVKIVKQVQSPFGTAPTNSFAYTSTSTLAGSAWAQNFSLNGGGELVRDYSSGERITITEGGQAAPWSFTSVSCVEGSGANARPVTGLTINGSTVTIPQGTTASSAQYQQITCTYTNTYTPTATLSLAKTVTSLGQPAPVAVPSDWTLTAAGEGTVAGRTISGASGTTAVTSQSVIAGTYQLSEVASSTANTGGYVQNGNWTCTNGVTPTAGGKITLAHGQSTTCTVNNRYQTGTLQVAKTVTSPTGGYTLGTGKAFTATYACTVGTRTVNGTVTVNPAAANGTAGAVATVANIPAGAQCVVTETAPTGSTDLANGSYVWGTPTYGPSSTVIVPSGGTARVDITNPVTQNTGSLTISKIVAPRAGTPATGYIGARTFPIGYVCTIGTTPAASGTVNVAAGGSQTVTGIPSTATCLVSETQAAVAGDFADASYRWDGVTFVQPAAIGVNATSTATVTNHFTRDLATLTVAKAVTGDGYTAGDAFSIDVACGDVSATVTIAGGASQNVSVPAGVACTVSEQSARPALAAGYVWVDPSYAGLTNGTVTVPAGATRTVTVTNPTAIGYNRLEIAKSLPNFAAQVETGTTFPVTVTCDRPAQGQTANYSDTLTFTTPLVGAQQTPYLPVGTSCSVVESGQPTGSAGLPDASYAWVAPTYQGLTDGAVVVPTSTTPASVTVVNDIVRVTGDFSIIKSVTNSTSATVSAPFTGAWSCTYGTDAPVTGTWTAPANGGTATRTGSAQLLLGSICSVTEDAPAAPVAGDASYVWATQLPQAVTVTASGATATVTNTLTRTTGSFSVTKSVDGGTAGTEFAATDFTFDWTCTPPSGADLSGTLAVAAGGSASPTEQIPAGSDCSVTERTGAALPVPVDPYRWTGVSFAVTGASGSDITDGVSFTTPADGAAVAVTATNTIAAQTGSVSATKRVTNLDGGFTGTQDDKLFPLTLSCTYPGDAGATTVGTTIVGVDETATWDDVPLGSSCSVQEGQILPGGLKDASFTWATVDYSPASVSVTDADRNPSIIVTNTLARVYGEIEIAKVFDDGGFTGVVPTDRSYDGTWSCSYEGGVVADGTWSGTGSAAGSVATLTATTGALDRIPLTASCTATENTLSAPSSDGSYVWLTPQITSIDTVATTGNRITVTNELGRETADVTVVKSLTGEVDGYVAGDGFIVGAVCAADPADLDDASATRMIGEVTVQAGASAIALIDDVPLGWSCRVNEAAVSGALYDASYAWDAPMYSHDGTAGNTFTVTAPTAVGVINPIVRVTDGLIVRKSLDGVPAGVVADDAVFDGSYACVYEDGTEREESFDGTWTATGAGEATLSPNPDMPLGTTCAVTETAPSADLLSDVSWAWTEPTITATSADVSADGPADLTVTNGVQRVYTGLTVTKAYVGLDGAFTDTLTVSGAWSCTLDGAIVASGAWTMPAAGGSVDVATVADGVIPAGASCAVTEDTLDDAALTDASYSWNDPVIDPAVVTAPNQVATLTVTNSTERVTGGFIVDKNVIRSAAVPATIPEAERTYQGAWSCSYGDDVRTGTWGPITADTTWVSPTDLPLTSVCQVTGEDDPGAPNAMDASYVWTQRDLGDAVTIGEVAPSPFAPFRLFGTAFAVSDVQPTITVENHVDRVTGTFAVSKTVEGDTAGVASDARFGFEWTCVDEGGLELPVDGPGSFTLAAGELWNAPSDIPVGSDCAVTETDLPAPNHASYAWSTTTAVDGGAATDGTSAAIVVSDAPSVIAFTNTLTRTIGEYSVSKTSDPGSGATVKPGDVIDYTVTVTPGAVGFVDDVIVTDDLSAVLGSAAFDDDSLEASQGTATRTGNTLTWNVGTVDAGAPLTLTYRVTVDADAWDRTLRNVVTSTGEVPPEECIEDCGTEHVTPAWSIAKTSDPASGAAVRAGDVITYTLTAKNTTTDAIMTGAVATDDLAGVLTYGELGDLPDGVTRTDDVLTWAVPDMAPGAVETVSYTVTVREGFDGVTLRNGVVPGPGGTCEGDCLTEHFTPKWIASKSADPASGSVVQTGDTVTYTLSVVNTGETVVGDAVVIDDLSDVLANATLAGELPAGAVLDGETLTWSVPELAIDETATVSYTVIVNDDADGVTLRNVITTDGPGGSCVEDCVTEHFTPKWVASKTSDPASGSAVATGDVITYTLAVTNEGPVAVDDAVVVDDLSEVLTNAELTGELPAGLVLSGETLTWSVPELAVGETATVSYTVTVHDDADGVTLRNVITTDGPGGSCVENCETEHMTPAWTIAKTSDPGSGAAIVGGDVITYTLTARNTSADVTLVGAVATDDLVGVITHAELGALPDGLTRDGDVLTWSIPDLAPGAEATVSYAVTVKEGTRGVTLTNGVIAGTGGGCTENCVTEHHAPKWDAAKTADPASGTAVKPGETVTYTLTVTNQGETVVDDAVVIDDLSEVLAFAELTGELGAGLALDGDTLTWTVPELAVGETATVSYAVVVDADARGATLRNVITTDGPGGGCETQCETEHPVPAWLLTKSSDIPSGSTVTQGQEITYTLTAVNVSEAVITGAVAFDDLSKVLPSASLTEMGSGLTRDGDVLTWAIPEIPVGGTVSVSYTVVVKNVFDRTITNVVSPGDSTGGACVDDCETTHEVPPPLAVTGADGPWGIGALALLVMMAGGAMIFIARRRRTV